MQDKKTLTETRLADANHDYSDNDNGNANVGKTTNGDYDNHINLYETLQNMNWSEEFRLNKLLHIPCFRDAGLIGITSMTVVCTTLYITQLRNNTLSRFGLFNWSMTSLIFGSILGWEQCRYHRRKNQLITDVAIETVKNKRRPMLTQDTLQDSANRALLQSEWNEHRNDTETKEGSTSWYKFW